MKISVSTSSIQARRFFFQVALCAAILAAPASVSAQILGNYQDDFSTVTPQSSSDSNWRYYWVDAKTSGGLTTWANYNLMRLYSGTFWAADNGANPNTQDGDQIAYIRWQPSKASLGTNTATYEMYNAVGFKITEYGGNPFSIIDGTISRPDGGPTNSGVTMRFFTRSPSNVLSEIGTAINIAAGSSPTNFSQSFGSLAVGSEILVLLRSTNVGPQSYWFGGVPLNFSVIPEPASSMLLVIGFAALGLRHLSSRRKSQMRG